MKSIQRYKGRQLVHSEPGLEVYKSHTRLTIVIVDPHTMRQIASVYMPPKTPIDEAVRYGHQKRESIIRINGGSHVRPS